MKCSDDSNLLTELLHVQYQCTLKSVQLRGSDKNKETATLNKIGMKMSSWASPVIPRYFLLERRRCSGFEGSYPIDPAVPYVCSVTTGGADKKNRCT